MNTFSKTLIITVILLVTSTGTAFSQLISMDSAANGQIYVSSGSHADFPGGYDAYLEYIKENMRYPAKAKKKGIQGNVTVQFIVKPDGSVNNVKVVSGVEKSLNKEAVRLIKSVPRWIPRKIDGKPVEDSISLTVYFEL